MVAHQKTCLVTGCTAGGVGASLAIAFMNRGYHVYATARSMSKVPSELNEAPNVTVLALDIESSESIASALAHVKEQTGNKLDVLINNAGVGLNMPNLDTPLDEAKKLFNVNFFGAFEMIHAFSPLIINTGGCIVNNSSVGGYAALPFLSYYQASKAALTQASEVLRLELAPLGVRVITLVTGGISTKFLNNQAVPPLPTDSYYKSVEDVIADTPDGVPFGMDPGTFASKVLGYVENDTKGKVWIGGAADMARFALWLFPRWAVDRISYMQKPFASRLARTFEEEKSGGHHSRTLDR